MLEAKIIIIITKQATYEHNQQICKTYLAPTEQALPYEVCRLPQGSS